MGDSRRYETEVGAELRSLRYRLKGVRAEMEQAITNMNDIAGCEASDEYYQLRVEEQSVLDEIEYYKEMT